MSVKNPLAREGKKTVHYMENLSFDPTHEVLTRIPLSLNPVSGDLERTTGIQGNASLVLTYDVDNNLEKLEKTIGGTTYTKTFTWTTDQLTAVSAWS